MHTLEAILSTKANKLQKMNSTNVLHIKNESKFSGM